MNTQKNVDIFLKEREPTDIDLIAAVREMLVSAGLLPEVIGFYDSSRYIQDGVNKVPEAQRFLLNKFWNFQLLTVNSNTVEERFCLITDGEYYRWLEIFKEKILPCAIANRLPKSLDSI